MPVTLKNKTVNIESVTLRFEAGDDTSSLIASMSCRSRPLTEGGVDRISLTASSEEVASAGNAVGADLTALADTVLSLCSQLALNKLGHSVLITSITFDLDVDSEGQTFIDYVFIRGTADASFGDRPVKCVLRNAEFMSALEAAAVDFATNYAELRALVHEAYKAAHAS